MKVFDKILGGLVMARYILGLFPDRTKKATRIVGAVAEKTSQVGAVLAGAGDPSSEEMAESAGDVPQI